MQLDRLEYQVRERIPWNLLELRSNMGIVYASSSDTISVQENEWAILMSKKR